MSSSLNLDVTAVEGARSEAVRSSRFRGWLSRLSEDAMGLLCLAGVVLTIVGSSLFVKYIYTEHSYSKPFLLTYIDTSGFALYLLGFACLPVWRSMPTASRRTRRMKPELEPLLREAEAPPPVRTLGSVLRLALSFYPLWFVDNLCANLALTMTSVSSAMVLGATAPLTTLVVGAVLGVERISGVRFVAAALAAGGVALVGLADRGQGGVDTLLGDLVALLSPVVYGIWVSLFKRKVGEEAEFSSALFLGIMGAANILLLWPVVWVLHLIRLETLVVPSPRLAAYMAANALLGTVVSDWLWLRSVLLLGPVAATVGLGLNVPLAMTVEGAVGGAVFRWWYVAGAALVVCGFLLATLDQRLASWVVGKGWAKPRAWLWGDVPTLDEARSTVSPAQ